MENILFYPPIYPPRLILSDKFRLNGFHLSLRAKNELAKDSSHLEWTKVLVFA